MFPAILRPPAFRIVEGDEVDAGMTSVDFDGVPNRPFVNVGQRDPKLEMTLVEDGPILIGEWFVIAAVKAVVIKTRRPRRASSS